MRVLLLEDDLQLGAALHLALIQAGMQPVWVRRVADARALLQTEHFSVALLDIGLPDGSGLDLLAQQRAAGSRMPVMMLSARDAVEDRVRGLDAGADDYLPKPFAVTELLSRMRALERRSAGQSNTVWRFGRLCIEPERQRVCVNDDVLELSLREFTLLVELARKAGRFVTRAHLEHVLFCTSHTIDSNMLEVHIHNLRKKVGAHAIRTIRGVGYLLEEQV